MERLDVDTKEVFMAEWRIEEACS